MRKFFFLCIPVLFFFMSCFDNSAKDEKNELLLMELKEQQIEMMKQIRENSDTLKRLETQNQKLQRLVERQQILSDRRFERKRRSSNAHRLTRMIEAMSRKHSPSEISEMLNKKHITTPEGQEWTEQNVQAFLNKIHPQNTKAE
ncbi:recombinase family protein [Desulfonema magnum]|uniref:Recombinase domain-containing protein n=1 Tax=Desulfonema magnum TaxID=45655 RepID=A0A975BM93_9BACT|nr:recombinase family protein [Desulfonema magnum]QTA87610.1 Recombinase domain-containing protein [Desulfonema magnum]